MKKIKLKNGYAANRRHTTRRRYKNKSRMPFSKKFTIAFRGDAINPNAKNVVKLFEDKTLSNFTKWPVINVDHHLMAVTYKSIPMSR